MLPQTRRAAATILRDTIRNQALCEFSNPESHHDLVSDKPKPDLGVLDEIKTSVSQEKFVDLERARGSNNEGDANGPTVSSVIPQTIAPASPPTHIHSEAPDGGFRAWLVVFGVHLVLVLCAANSNRSL